MGRTGMNHEFAETMDQLAKAHAALKADDPRALAFAQHGPAGALIESACVAAAVVQRSWAAAGLPPSVPAPWPASTREFEEARRPCPHLIQRRTPSLVPSPRDWMRRAQDYAGRAIALAYRSPPCSTVD